MYVRRSLVHVRGGGEHAVNGKIMADLDVMKREMGKYLNKGRAVGFQHAKDEPLIAVKPERRLITHLKKIEHCDVQFYAVDCSTRTLKRANNWGIYLLRVTSAQVKTRRVDWNFREAIRTVVGDAHVRRKILQDMRLELESEMALKLLGDAEEKDYLLLDGASYFGGERKFRALLYEQCEKMQINLLAISKKSPMLKDEKGHDFIAAAYMLAPCGVWVYHPVRRADIHAHLYGDVSLVKLCQDSPRIFRCDVMNYLTSRDICEVISPLTAISEDPRCLGYPVALWLAHDFSSVAESKLLQYHDKVEEELESVGLLDRLRQEELACNFPDELHGAKYAFRKEWIESV